MSRKVAYLIWQVLVSSLIQYAYSDINTCIHRQMIMHHHRVLVTPQVTVAMFVRHRRRSRLRRLCPVPRHRRRSHLRRLYPVPRHSNAADHDRLENSPEVRVLNTRLTCSHADIHCTCQLRRSASVQCQMLHATLPIRTRTTCS